MGSGYCQVAAATAIATDPLAFPENDLEALPESDLWPAAVPVLLALPTLSDVEASPPTLNVISKAAAPAAPQTERLKSPTVSDVDALVPVAPFELVAVGVADV